MNKYLIPFVSALFGVVFALAVWHLYIDHKNFHAVLNAIVTQQKAQTNEAPK